jgi:hypothetical protein
MKTKNKGLLSIIILIFFGLILLNLISNVLTENIPDEFSNFLKTFPEETLGMEYKWFWSISTVSVMLLLLFLTWRTHLFTAKEQASEPNLNNTQKTNTTGNYSPNVTVAADGVNVVINQGYGISDIPEKQLMPTRKGGIPHSLGENAVFPDTFIGREKDLKEIRNRLTQGDGFLLLVNGEGGIGKSTLAAKYYYTYKNDYKHCAWLVNEQGIGPTLLQLEIPLGLTFAPDATREQRLQQLAHAPWPTCRSPACWCWTIPTSRKTCNSIIPP